MKEKIPTVSVSFVVYRLDNGFCLDEAIYVCGNHPKLGAWNPENALALKLTKSGVYRLTRKLPEGYDLEFKIIRKPTWQTVEKGCYGEEIENHKYTLTQKTIAPVVISRWRCD